MPVLLLAQSNKLAEAGTGHFIDHFEAAQKYLNIIKANYNKKDISNSASLLKAHLKKYPVSAFLLGVSEKQLIEYENIGYESELQAIVKRAQHAAQYRDIKKEFDEYQAISQKLGLNDEKLKSNLKSVFAPLSQKGRQALQQESKNCQPEVDISKSLGPPRNQDSVGWCASFAEADLVSHKLGKKISAADLAINYGLKNNRKVLASDKEIKAAQAMGIKDLLRNGVFLTENLYEVTLEAKGGVCLEKDFSSEDNYGGEILENYIKIKKQKSSFFKSPGTCLATLNKISPNVTKAQAVDFLEKATTEEAVSYLNQISCKKRYKPDQKLISRAFPDFASLENTNTYFKYINENLSKKNPTIIGYNAARLQNINTEDSERHASVIVGRRFNKDAQNCEYLIRNSWGSSCAMYDPVLDCKDGHIWVPKEILTRDEVGIKYFE